jgi:tetratricopeptide (TPR) repeat protein
MKEPSIAEEVEACNAAANLCIQRGDPQGAYEHLSRALGLFRSSPDPKRQAALLNNLGHVQVSLRRFHEAADSFTEAASLYELLGDRTAAAWQMGNVGSVHRDREEHASALESYGKALSIFEAQDDSMGIADQSGNIGYIHAMIGDREAALAWFRKAKVLYESLGQEQKASLADRNIRLLTTAGEGK